MKKRSILLLALVIIFLNLTSIHAAHYVVGNVQDAIDSTSPNGFEVVVWNPTYGISENVTDTVGPSGNSGSNNYYMVDCEALTHPCVVGEVLNISLIPKNNYFSKNTSITVTGAGYDQAQNLKLYPPLNITSFTLNQSFTCGKQTIKVVCNLTGDAKNVTIGAKTLGFEKNYTATNSSLFSYYADIQINKTGIWNFTCMVKDQVNKTDSKTNSSFRGYSSSPDLSISSKDIFFSKNDPHEGETITIYTNVHNNGCQDANNFQQSFYKGDPSLGGIKISNTTISVPKRSNSTASIPWSSKIGPTNIFSVSDIAGEINDPNTTNNKANKTIDVTSWEIFYGNVTSNKVLGNSNKSWMNFWFNDSISTGVTFITDKESIIHWDSLLAIGRTKLGAIASNDFSDIDTILDMTNYNDSVSKIFTTDGSTPKQTENFSIYSRNVSNVPVINSTNNTNFKTGILWDSSYDTNGQFDTTDNENIVFATKINQKSQGKYGVYDYETRIPVKLRDQHTADTSELYFYYELS